MCDVNESENDESMLDQDPCSRISGSTDRTQMQQEVIILDCQNPSEFHEAHIRGALNITFPSIMVRRIAAGKIDLFDKSKELKAKMANTKMTFVVYDSHVPGGGTELSDLVSMVAKKLAQNGCRVATLKGKTLF
jgi:dual specificity MAP kinase phosphatase